MKYKLRFNPQEIHKYADRYCYPRKHLEEAVKDQKTDIQKRGYLKKSEFVKVVDWKSRRTLSRFQNGCTEDQIKEATTTALNTKDEQERIKSLTRLYGVDWPIASVILHFYHKDPYPIIDKRALWSLSLPNYKSYNRWLKYTDICIQLAKENNVDMRTLDRALWQYANENQPVKN